MRVLVLVKHVPDTTEVRFDAASNELRVRQAPTKINNYDEHAIEAAARLREQLGAEVVLACVGPADAAKTMKAAIAAGGDRAVLVSGPWSEAIDATAVAAILVALVAKEGPFDLIFGGDVSEDGYNALVPGLVASALDAPFVRGVSALRIGDGSVEVTRQLEGFEEVYRVGTPAVLSVSNAINEPRTVTTLQMMKVPMSKIVTISAADLGIAETFLEPESMATRIIGIRPAAQARRRQVITGEPDDVVREVIAELEKAGVLV